MPAPLSDILHEWLHIVMRRSMHNLIIYAKEKNHSMAQLNALFRIHHIGVCGISDLGEEMGVTSAAASQLLDRLVQQGLVIRTEDPTDRRNKRVALTEAGEAIVQESIAARQGWLDHLAEKLTPAEREQVHASLQLLINNAKTLG